MQDENCKAVTITERTCKYCGLPIENAAKYQQSHDDCRRNASNAYHREYWARTHEKKYSKAPKPPKPDKFCLMCGKPLAEYGNRRRDYCPECVILKQKTRLEKYNKQTREECKNARLKKSPVKKKKRKKPISHCWDLECKSIDQVNIEARSLGLSYGKYSSLCDNLFIEPYLNEQGIYDGLDRITKAWHDFKKEKKRQEEVDRIARQNSVFEIGL